MSTSPIVDRIVIIVEAGWRNPLDAANVTVGSSIVVASPGLSPTARVAEIVGIAGVPGALAKSLLLRFDDNANFSRMSLGEVLDIAGALALRFPGTVPLGIALTVGSMVLSLYQHKERQLDERVRRSFDEARSPVHRDPLAIDLDGDGLETFGLSGTNPVLFDHDGDGVRTGTGWLRPDDGWLVRDLSGNGTIDGGHELFGVDTWIQAPLGNGQHGTGPRKAYTGFEALRALDSNNDGRFSSLDSAWSEVKIWRDLNSDGISQSNELLTLPSQQITAIRLQDDGVRRELGNGNAITGTAVVERSSGNLNVSGVNLSASNLDLADSPFYREFPDRIPHTTTAAALPEMGGSGRLRDLREAMSQGSSEAGLLTGAVSSFASLQTRAQQLAALDPLLKAWAETSPETVRFVDWARTVDNVTIGEDAVHRTHRITSNAKEPFRSAPSGSYATFEFNSDLYIRSIVYPNGVTSVELTAEGVEVLNRINILEAFTGSRFIDFTTVSRKGGGGASGGGGGGGGSVASPWTLMARVPMDERRIELVDEAYQSLRDSVYRPLALQTRLRPYLDALDLTISNTGIQFDATGVRELFDSVHAADPQKAIEDLAELAQFAMNTLVYAGFDPLAQLRPWVEALPADSPIHQTLREIGVYGSTTGLWDEDGLIALGGSGNDSLVGWKGSDKLDGGSGGDGLHGGVGNDFLYGRDGDDKLWGGNDDDFLDGGAGTDWLRGELGNNTYAFGRGDGQDHIPVFDDSTAEKLNVLRFKEGVSPADVIVRQVDRTDWGWTADLEFSIRGTQDRIVAGGMWYGAGGSGNRYASVQEVHFADGTVWSYETVRSMFLTGSEDADVRLGTIGNDQMLGAGGNDILDGAAGDDLIDGGAGDDLLKGSGGNDTLVGGFGADVLQGGEGNDTLDGGPGADVLNGGSGNNRYLFGRGDGQDFVEQVQDLNTLKSSVLVFKAGVLPEDIRVRQVHSAFWGWGSDLEFSILGTQDRVTVGALWRGLQGGPTDWTPVQSVEFSNGVVWTADMIRARIFTGTEGADTITGGALNDTLQGFGGADTLVGGAGDDLLEGGDGADSLDGGLGNDVLDGGTGNDTLNGGVGNNRYLFGRGDGQDFIAQLQDATAGKTSVLEFKAGVTPADLSIRQVHSSFWGNVADLEFSIRGTSDRVTVGAGWRGLGAGGNMDWTPVQQVRFADGTTWDAAAIRQHMYAGSSGNDVLLGTPGADVINGQAGDDNLSGAGGDDTLNGGAGNDTLDGGLGNDVLDGGAGNDTLNGGAGNNRYLFGRGDGQDIIPHFQDTTAGKTSVLEFKAGVLPSDLLIRQLHSNAFGNVADLEFSIRGTTDRITVGAGWRGLGAGGNMDWTPVQQVRFADGTTWDAAAIRQHMYAGSTGSDVLLGTPGADVINGQAGDDNLSGAGGDDTLNGGTGNDTLDGGLGNDVLDGGAGNDTLNGGAGNNRYLFGRGDGQDFIAHFQDTTAGKNSVLEFKSGVLPSDVTVRAVFSSAWGSTANLEFSILGTTDRVTVSAGWRGMAPGGNGDWTPVQSVQFADGTVWGVEEIRNLVASLPPAGAPLSATGRQVASLVEAMASFGGTTSAAEGHPPFTANRQAFELPMFATA